MFPFDDVIMWHALSDYWAKKTFVSTPVLFPDFMFSSNIEYKYTHVFSLEQHLNYHSKTDEVPVLFLLSDSQSGELYLKSKFRINPELQKRMINLWW